MAFTGVPVVKRVSDSLVRVTGISLDAGAVGTISLFDGAGEIKLPPDFKPTVYGNQGGAASGSNLVTLQDSIEITHLNAVPINVVKTGTLKTDWLATFTNLNTLVTNAPITIVNVVTDPTITLSNIPGTGPWAQFYGNTTGTGSEGDDYAATVAVGAAVPFPRSGPSLGTGLVPGGLNQFVLPLTGRYRVSWAVDFVEASQLQVDLSGVAQTATTSTSGAGTQQNTNTVVISAGAGDLLSIINPAGNAAALTVQPADGSLTHAQAPSLLIEFLGEDELEPTAIATGTAVVSTAEGGASSAPAPTGALEIYIRHH